MKRNWKTFSFQALFPLFWNQPPFGASKVGLPFPFLCILVARMSVVAEWTRTNQALAMVSKLPTPKIPSDQQCFAHVTEPGRFRWFANIQAKRHSFNKIPLRISPTDWVGPCELKFSHPLGSEEWGWPLPFCRQYCWLRGPSKCKAWGVLTLVRQCCLHGRAHQMSFMRLRIRPAGILEQKVSRCKLYF